MHFRESCSAVNDGPYIIWWKYLEKKKENKIFSYFISFLKMWLTGKRFDDSVMSIPTVQMKNLRISLKIWKYFTMIKISFSNTKLFCSGILWFIVHSDNNFERCLTFHEFVFTNPVISLQLRPLKISDLTCQSVTRVEFSSNSLTSLMSVYPLIGSFNHRNS